MSFLATITNSFDPDDMSLFSRLSNILKSHFFLKKTKRRTKTPLSSPKFDPIRPLTLCSITYLEVTISKTLFGKKQVSYKKKKKEEERKKRSREDSYLDFSVPRDEISPVTACQNDISFSALLDPLFQEELLLSYDLEVKRLVQV
jgi:hypothetical protein